jgi:SAM-dependent methyltransferase
VASAGGFRPEYFAELAQLEPGHFWFESRNALIVWSLRKHFPGLRSFLEVGCGTGFVLTAIASAFPAARLAGVEAFGAGLVFARQRLPGVELLELDAQRLPYDAEFEAAGAFDVIEHVDRDEEVLAQLGRAVVEGGALLLTVPQHPWFWSYQDDLVCHVRRYAAVDLRRKVERAGFEVLDTVSFVSLLFPAMWLSRRLPGRRQARGDDGMADIRIGRWQNRVLGVVMAWERALIRAGLRFPVGGSLLLVARKSTRPLYSARS